MTRDDETTARDTVLQDAVPNDRDTAFDEAAFTRTLQIASEYVGVTLTARQTADCLIYTRLLLGTNAHTNLTRITEPGEIAIKHFADSLTCFGAVGKVWDRERPAVCDVGTGAGFPGLVLKIVRPDLRLTLLDSLRKRLTFLEAVCATLGLEGVLFVHARAEEAGRDPALRDGFDVVTARAVAALPTLLEWCAPLARPGGHFLAMKGGNVDAELAGAADAARLLNVRLAQDRVLTLPPVPGSDEPPAERRVLIYRKAAPTPPRFPRIAAEIKRQGL